MFFAPLTFCDDLDLLSVHLILDVFDFFFQYPLNLSLRHAFEILGIVVDDLIAVELDGSGCLLSFSYFFVRLIV